MSKVLRIAILSPAHPLRGGIAASSERLALALQAAGASVVIYSYRLQYPALLFPGKTQYTSDLAPEGLDIRPMIHSMNPFNWLRVGRLLARQAPDLLICRFWLPFLAPALGSICRLARRNRHTRVVALTDNIMPHEARFGDRLLTRYFLGSADAVLALSKVVEEQARRLAPRLPASWAPHPIYDIHGAPVGREEALAYLGLPTKPRYLLFFGFVRRYKGLDLLLRALADERLRRLPLRLLVAGEFYEDAEEYRRLIGELDLEDRVSLFAEYIPNEAVKYYFGAADLVVQPYRSATQSGISQIAYHFETPMVVTRVGGLPEFVADGEVGYVVEVDPQAIAGAIDDFFTQRRGATMRRAVKEAKRSFSWERLAATIFSLQAQLASK